MFKGFIFVGPNKKIFLFGTRILVWGGSSKEMLKYLLLEFSIWESCFLLSIPMCSSNLSWMEIRPMSLWFDQKPAGFCSSGLNTNCHHLSVPVSNFLHVICLNHGFFWVYCVLYNGTSSYTSTWYWMVQVIWDPSLHRRAVQGLKQRTPLSTFVSCRNRGKSPGKRWDGWRRRSTFFHDWNFTAFLKYVRKQ